MATLCDENTWEDLLSLIQSRKVIPVVGAGVVTFGGDNLPLQPWLAQRLAERLGLPPKEAPGEWGLNEAVCEWLVRDPRHRNRAYTKLDGILREDCPEPGQTVRELASIGAFNLYLSTTFDPLLERALNQERFSGKALTQVRAFFPGGDSGETDLPGRMRDLSRPAVYHLLGKVSSSAQEYVACEEDALEFVCALQQKMPEQLARDLKEHTLLLLGLNFSDWLVRFFLRIAKQTRLSQLDGDIEYLTEAPSGALSESMVMFFGKMIPKVEVIPCDPRAFVAELSRRWRRMAPEKKGGADPEFALPPEREMPHGAIFISYAREDEPAVRRLKAGLEKHGCRVWYDRERLTEKPGANWRNSLHDEVTAHCALFVSVISLATESQSEAYFHLERNWAAERARRFAQDEVFYIPVVIDDSPMRAAREPRIGEKPNSGQGTRLPGGEVTPEFGQSLRRLQEERNAVRAVP